MTDGGDAMGERRSYELSRDRPPLGAGCQIKFDLWRASRPGGHGLQEAAEFRSEVARAKFAVVQREQKELIARCIGSGCKRVEVPARKVDAPNGGGRRGAGTSTP